MEKEIILHGKKFTLTIKLAINLIPVFGIFFLHWNSYAIFVIYLIETLIIGIFVVIKMIYAGVYWWVKEKIPHNFLVYIKDAIKFLFNFGMAFFVIFYMLFRFATFKLITFTFTDPIVLFYDALHTVRFAWWGVFLGQCILFAKNYLLAKQYEIKDMKKFHKEGVYALLFYLFVLIFGTLPGFIFGQDGIIVTAVAIKIVYDLKHNPARYLLGIIDKGVAFLNEIYTR